MNTINCLGKLLDLSKPRIMAILNVTNDSFYDGGRYVTNKQILDRVEEMLAEGAATIDIGAMSSRPGAEIVDVEEELLRITPVVKLINKEFPDAILSIDTVHSKVAKECVDLGARMINDISGGRIDESMWQMVSKLKVPFIAMHMKGLPKNMQNLGFEESNLSDVLAFFVEIKRKAEELEIKDLIIDPGFGFGKSMKQNYQILKGLEVLKILEAPLLIGLSRKSMIYKYLEITPDLALNGTSALHMLALQNGANMLRVHDVKEAAEVIRLYEMYQLS